MLFIRTVTVALGRKLDSALASTHLTNINIAVHTPEVTHDKTLTGSYPMVRPSQFKRETLIIPLTYRGYTDPRVSAGGVALTRSTGWARWQLDRWRQCKQKREGEQPRGTINPLNTSTCHSAHAAVLWGESRAERGKDEERKERQEWNQGVRWWKSEKATQMVKANMPDSKHMIISRLVY